MTEWKDSMSTDEKLLADEHWYYVPPYENEGHKIVDSAGQEVATFEDKESALKCVTTFNNQIDRANKKIEDNNG